MLRVQGLPVFVATQVGAIDQCAVHRVRVSFLNAGHNGSRTVKGATQPSARLGDCRTGSSGAAAARTPLTCTSVVGLGRFELPTS